MMRASWFSILTILAFVATRPINAAPGDIDHARQQFGEFYLGTPATPDGNLTLKGSNEPPPNTGHAAEYVETLRPDGSWPDLDYASKARSGWPPATHWTRMLAIVAAEQMPGAKLDASTADAAVHRALAFWAKHDFTCPNWWYNQIGIPQLAGTTALLFRDRLTADETRYLTGTLLPRAKIAMTGQNRVWLSGNTLMLALLEGNEALAATAAKSIWDEVEVTTAEGIQPDFSFHQHGPQQQFGNYGLSLAVEICRWGTVLRDTPWSLPPAKLAAYRGFLLNGEAWVVWRGWMDVSACDRQLELKAQTSKARTLERVMRNVAEFDGKYAPAYRGYVRRNHDASAPNDFLGNRVFWRSDYVIHRRPDFAAMLKLSSRRVIGAEMVNTENLLGYHLADGALYLYRRGDEYDDIFPVWDWQKLPGITAAQRPDGPPRYEHVRGERDFVGGATDGTHGVAVLDLARDGVEAHKAWFFGDEAVVGLGADIRKTGLNPVVTSINQCLRRGPVVVKRRGQQPAPFPEGEQRLADVEWVEHDGWRYTFLAPAIVHLQVGPQTGNWNRVFRNPETPIGDVTRDVFALWIDHAASTAGSYAYAIRPAASVASEPETIVNAPSVQAVRLSGSVLAVAFWAPGEQQLTPGVLVKVDHPCVMIADERSGRIFMSDPTQKLAAITVTVNGRAKLIGLPQGGEAGRTVDFRF